MYAREIRTATAITYCVPDYVLAFLVNDLSNSLCSRYDFRFFVSPELAPAVMSAERGVL
jgi:hypothetical protein